MAGGALAGKVAIVPVDALYGGLVTRLAAEGATVVLVAPSGEGREEAGRLASDIQSGGGRAAVFVLDPADGDSLDALVDFVAELFP